jgi:beta-N-acetylhexosaminidase
VDSHLALPRVEANHLEADLLPFALNTDLPWAMSAHIVYPAWDALPATLSPKVIGTIIRERIGFEGVLVTDDLAMKALSDPPADLARQSLAAGCDIALYCSGEPEPTAELLATCPKITEAAAVRLAAARMMAARRRLAIDATSLVLERDRLAA